MANPIVIAHHLIWTVYGEWLEANEESMNKGEPNPQDDDLRTEYSRESLGNGVRGKHLEAYRKGANIALIAPDLRQEFPDDDAINEALRSVVQQRKRSA